MRYISIPCDMVIGDYDVIKQDILNSNFGNDSKSDALEKEIYVYDIVDDKFKDRSDVIIDCENVLYVLDFTHPSLKNRYTVIAMYNGWIYTTNMSLTDVMDLLNANSCSIFYGCNIVVTDLWSLLDGTESRYITNYGYINIGGISNVSKKLIKNGDDTFYCLEVIYSDDINSIYIKSNINKLLEFLNKHTSNSKNL